MDPKNLQKEIAEQKSSMNGADHHKAAIYRDEKVKYFKKLILLIILLIIALSLLSFAIYLISNKYLN